MVLDRHSILCYIFNYDNCVLILQVKKLSSQGLNQCLEGHKQRGGQVERTIRMCFCLGPLCLMLSIFLAIGESNEPKCCRQLVLVSRTTYLQAYFVHVPPFVMHSCLFSCDYQCYRIPLIMHMCVSCLQYWLSRC